MRHELEMTYVLAGDITAFIGSAFAGKQPPKFEEMHPIAKPKSEMNAEQKAILFNERLKEFTKSFNKKFTAEKV